MNKFLKRALAVCSSILITGLSVYTPFSACAGEFRYGDTNADGNVNLYDAINVCRHLLKSPELTDENLERADYNRDGVVDLYDAISISRLILSEKKVYSVTDFVNTRRSEKGIEPLSIDLSLVDASMKRAGELAIWQKKAVRPDGSDYTTVFGEYDVTCRKSDTYSGTGTPDPQSLCATIFKKSEQAKNALLSEDYSRIGVGYYTKDSIYYWIIILAD